MHSTFQRDSQKDFEKRSESINQDLHQYKRNLSKGPSKETHKRDLQKGTKQIYIHPKRLISIQKRLLKEIIQETYTRDPCKDQYQHTATHCNTLQHTATHCNTATRPMSTAGGNAYNTMQNSSATHCNTLQHTATYCNILRRTAPYCSVLQHPATRCNIL